MGENPSDKRKDSDLVKAAETGLSEQGAVVEMMRRLKDSDAEHHQRPP